VARCHGAAARRERRRRRKKKCAVDGGGGHAMACARRKGQAGRFSVSTGYCRALRKLN
jgi:hypothetical protein